MHANFGSGTLLVTSVRLVWGATLPPGNAQCRVLDGFGAFRLALLAQINFRRPFLLFSSQ